MRESALCDRHAKCACHVVLTRVSLSHFSAQVSRKKKILQRGRSFQRLYHPFPTSSSVMMVDISSHETISPSRFGISTWRADQSRRFPFTIICEANCATCTRMTASLTSLSAYGAVMTSTRSFHLSAEISDFLSPRHVLTGSYHNYFRIYDSENLSDVVLQADKSAFKARKIGGAMPGSKLGVKNGRPGGTPFKDTMPLEALDFNKKILHASWHPRENTIAVREWFRDDLCD